MPATSMPEPPSMMAPVRRNLVQGALIHFPAITILRPPSTTEVANFLRALAAWIPMPATLTQMPQSKTAVVWWKMNVVCAGAMAFRTELAIAKVMCSTYVAIVEAQVRWDAPTLKHATTMGMLVLTMEAA
jgi:hypothetical protein